MSTLPDFRLATYISRWEFKARYHMTASDAQTLPLSQLLSLAEPEEREAWEQLTLGYTETWGAPALRSVIAATYAGLASEDILCFAGAEEGIYCAMSALLSPDDHAIVTVPNYQSMEAVPVSICGSVSGVALRAENGWALDLNEMRAALRPNTRLIAVNFPNNPTGAVAGRETFDGIVALCAERGIHLFNDEVYRRLERDPARRLPQVAEVYDKGVSLNGMSKAYGLPGLRTGWIASRDRILPKNRDLCAANLAHLERFFSNYPDLYDWSEPDGGCVGVARYKRARRRGRALPESFGGVRCAVDSIAVIPIPASAGAAGPVSGRLRPQEYRGRSESLARPSRALVPPQCIRDSVFLQSVNAGPQREFHRRHYLRMQTPEPVDDCDQIIRRSRLDEVMAPHPPRRRLIPRNVHAASMPWDTRSHAHMERTLGQADRDAILAESESRSAVRRLPSALPHGTIVRPSMSLAAGTRLGPYELLVPIGAGGMGEVYRARDTRLDRIVAVKVIKEQFSERVEREARAVAALNHSNICQLYDVGPNYLVMEYIEGTPLKGPLPVDLALKYAAQICDALDAAHKKGITHRDLKPANILVTATGLKLLDFGLAQVETAAQCEDATQPMGLTQAGTILGTASYMSPEQAEAKSVDARSDIFSFGVVLYEMLTGRRAFQGDSVIAILAAILSKEPAPLGAGVSAELRNIVARCLRKSRADRFQSALELRAALESASTEKATETQPSIAVLPFANMSRDEDNEYFSDGLAEEIINVLAHIPGLKVIARTSTFAFRGKEQDIRKIAEALGVRTILEGSVRRAGNRIRVTAQLIGAEDGSHLWSERYDREMADVFALQDEIAAAIAAALRIKLAVQPADARQYTPNLASYEALLRAWHYHVQYTPESMKRAREYLEQAAALDPGYAPAHSALGLYFGTLAVLGLMSAHEATPLARVALQKALSIDPSLPDALAALGWIAATYDYNLKEAERLFGLAMASNPVPPKVLWYVGHYLLSMGRSNEAIEEMEHALESDPLNVAYRRSLACCLLGAGREADAARECRRMLELDQSEYWAYLLLCIIHAQGGQIEEAVQNARQAYSLAPWYSPVAASLAAMLLRSGDTSGAEAMLLKLGDGQAYGAPLAFVNYFLLSSEIDLAADWVERAIGQRDPALHAFLRFPYAKELLGSPRWPALAKMMNLPDAA